ncbi:MAG: acetoacetate--CoA ligase, partial [Deltaproteobacteria bacterium]
MGKKLWEPSEEWMKSSIMYKFMMYINEKYNKQFNEYEELYQWSIDNIPEFWASLWDYADIIHSRS